MPEITNVVTSNMSCGASIEGALELGIRNNEAKTISLEQQFEMLNRQFILFVQSCVKVYPSADLTPCVEDYLSHAKGICDMAQLLKKRDSIPASSHDSTLRCEDRKDSVVTSTIPSTVPGIFGSLAAPQAQNSFPSWGTVGVASCSNNQFAPFVSGVSHGSGGSLPLTSSVGFKLNTSSTDTPSIVSASSLTSVPSFSFLPQTLASNATTNATAFSCFGLSSSNAPICDKPETTVSSVSFSDSSVRPKASITTGCGIFTNLALSQQMAEKSSMCKPIMSSLETPVSQFNNSTLTEPIVVTSDNNLPGNKNVFAGLPSFFPPNTLITPTSVTNTQQPLNSNGNQELFSTSKTNQPLFGQSNLFTVPNFTLPTFTQPIISDGFVPKSGDEEDDENTVDPTLKDSRDEKPGHEENAVCSVRSKLFFKRNHNFHVLGVGILNIKKIEEDEDSLHFIFRLESSRANSVLMNIKYSKQNNRYQLLEEKSLLIISPANPPIRELVELNEGEEYKTVSYLIKTPRVEDMNVILSYLKPPDVSSEQPTSQHS